MSELLRYDDVSVDDALPRTEFPVTRATLVRYAGASGDFNEIHWNERVAREVGLPDVIAHGNLTMALAGRVLTAWAGDPAALVEYGVRFTKPVVVPDDGTGALLVVEGVIKEKLEGNLVRVDLMVTSEGTRVLGQARAVVRLA
jgi:acyl dehydratase